jgi:hypothetical protein
LVESSSPTESARGGPIDSAHAIALRLTVVFALLILTFSTPVGDCVPDVLSGFPLPMLRLGGGPEEGILPYAWAINFVADAVLVALFFRGVKRFVVKKSAVSVWVGGLGFALYYALFASTAFLLTFASGLSENKEWLMALIFTAGPFYYPLLLFDSSRYYFYDYFYSYDHYSLLHFSEFYSPRLLLLPTLLLYWLLGSGLVVLWRRFRRLFGTRISSNF